MLDSNSNLFLWRVCGFDGRAEFDCDGNSVGAMRNANSLHYVKFQLLFLQLI